MTTIAPEKIAELRNRHKSAVDSFEAKPNVPKIGHKDFNNLQDEIFELLPALLDLAESALWRTDWENMPKDGTPVLIDTGQLGATAFAIVAWDESLPHPAFVDANCDSYPDARAWPARKSPMTDPFPYIYRWNRCGRKGQRCKVTARGSMNSCRLEFPDGFIMITSRNALMRADCK